MPNPGQIRRFLEPCDLEIWRTTFKNNRAPLLCYIATSSFVQHFVAIGEFKLELQSGNAQFGSKSTIFWAVWPSDLTDDLEKQLGTSSMLLQALCIFSYPLVNSNWSYSPETPNLGQIWQFLEPCDLEIWRMTFKNNRAPLLSNIKLSIISSYVNSNWSYSPETVKLGCDLCDLDLWPWPFAWTLPWSMVRTPENFMMIWWWEHSQKGVTDRQKIPFIELLGHS